MNSPEPEPAADLEELVASDPRHKKAARIARVMVADLYLYYKEDVEEGIRRGDFYERNKDALDDIRTTYESRVDQSVRDEADHLGPAIEQFIAEKREQLELGSNGGEPAEAEGDGEDGAEDGADDDYADDPRHKKAARIARVMVADLYLYYKENVEEGLRCGDFYERNKDALDDIRTTYESRVDESVREEKDHLGPAIERFTAEKREELGLADEARETEES